MSGLWRRMGRQRAYVILVLLCLAVGVVAWKHADQVGSRLQTEIQSSCASAVSVGTAPVVPPHGGQPSKLGVTIVSNFRQQWHTLHCPGSLPQPPGFAHWAAVYHLPAS